LRIVPAFGRGMDAREAGFRRDIRRHRHRRDAVQD
jgi:hypothetical protein